MLFRIKGTNKVMSAATLAEEHVGSYKVTGRRRISTRSTGRVIFLRVTLLNGQSFSAYCLGKDHAICRL
jgi:hypothetical protein